MHYFSSDPASRDQCLACPCRAWTGVLCAATAPVGRPPRLRTITGSWPLLGTSQVHICIILNQSFGLVMSIEGSCANVLSKLLQSSSTVVALRLGEAS